MKKKIGILLFCTMMLTTPVFADTTHVVKSGDTLYKIAKTHKTTYEELAKYNNISNPNKIFVGDVIRIPGMETTEATVNPNRVNPSLVTPVVTPIAPVATVKPVEPTTPKVGANPDSVSAASAQAIYYKDGTWSKETFVEKFRDGISKHAAVTIATVNADGTPNSATIVPSLVEGETEYLKLATATEGNTIINIKERKYAVITAYQHNPEEADKFVRNNGIRLVVELVEDKAVIDKFNVGNKAPDKTVYLKIVKYLTLG